MTLLITGGAGFMGTNFVLDWLARSDEHIINLDLLTYAGSYRNLAALDGNPRHVFVEGDICNRELLDVLLRRHEPSAIVHFAAESHVDRSIHNSERFIRTNVGGTHTLLEAARAYWDTLAAARRDAFRFLHISTDEVYGPLEPTDAPVAESRAYQPGNRTRRAKPPATTSCVHGTTHMDCPPSSPTAATTSGCTSFRRS